MSGESSGQDFYDLLIRYSQEPDPENRKLLENKIWNLYGVEVSILVVDMSGFTRLSQTRGIVHYLSMVRRMQLTAEPIIESYGGVLVKYEADNAFAYFQNPGNAIRAAIALKLGLDSANILTPEDLDIHISCGIDFGKCLLPTPSDFYGTPVNRASKLGEDLGEPDQILVTEEAMSCVPPSLEIKSRKLTYEIGGQLTNVYAIEY